LILIKQEVGKINNKLKGISSITKKSFPK